MWAAPPNVTAFSHLSSVGPEDGRNMQHAELVAQIMTTPARLDSGINVDAGGFRRNPSRTYTYPGPARRERAAFRPMIDRLAVSPVPTN